MVELSQYPAIEATESKDLRMGIMQDAALTSWKRGCRQAFGAGPDILSDSN
jgi:hypothetical protein